MNDQQAPTDATDADVDPITQARASHATLRYTTMRVAIFVVAMGLLWLVRVRGALLIALALLISGLASYALLRSQRDAMSSQLATASTRRRERSAARAAREDEFQDDAEAPDVEWPGVEVPDAEVPDSVAPEARDDAGNGPGR